MIAVVVGLASALVYGAGDFVGGIASRRILPVRVVALSAATGIVLLVPLALLIPARWSEEAIVWGALSGVANAGGLLLLYAALAIGPMSVLSPITAVLAAIVPVGVSLVLGDALSPLAAGAIGMALVAVVLVSLVRGPEGDRVGAAPGAAGEAGPARAARVSPRGLAYAIGSGVLIGVIIVLLDQAPHDSGVVPLLLNRSASCLVISTIVVVLALVARRRGVPLSAGWRAGILVAPICGVLDVIANSLILTSLRLGELAVTSVLAALYPVGTIALAAVVLRERVSPVQWCGIGLAIIAAALLAVA
ncbi:EamA family transporter [Homoserinibacter sp. YIM 151385]|uniref:EamA family transporter n=1 Tax=Homoserinibacter sp. YIM 151385 TaxID=2985506 RepID=UPI0022F075F2|nr:EamA family transporter [Homoserinibacter sp. YIM 151385]WBU37426.1 EamA family transporter [Homoserinibacter sp. YIM 151385]